MDVTLFIATKAFIKNKDGKVLLLRESDKYEEGTGKGTYDVPGGRLTPGENFRDALIREVKEETGLTITIDRPITVDEWRPEVNGNKWQIVGIFFECTALDDDVSLSDDHDDHVWIDPKDYESYTLIGKMPEVFAKYLE